MAKEIDWGQEYEEYVSEVDALDQIDAESVYDPADKKYYKFDEAAQTRSTVGTSKYGVPHSSALTEADQIAGIEAGGESLPFMSFNTSDQFYSSAENLINEEELGELSGKFSAKEIKGIKEDYNKALKNLGDFESTTGMDEDYARMLFLENAVISKEGALNISNVNRSRGFGYPRDIQEGGRLRFGEGPTDIYGIQSTEKGRKSPFYNLGELDIYDQYSKDPRIDKSQRDSFVDFENQYEQLSLYLNENHPDLTLPKLDIAPQFSQGKAIGGRVAFDPSSIGGEEPGGISSLLSDSDLMKLKNAAKNDPVLNKLYESVSGGMGIVRDFMNTAQMLYKEDSDEYAFLYNKFSDLQAGKGDGYSVSDLEKWKAKTKIATDAQILLKSAYK